MILVFFFAVGGIIAIVAGVIAMFAGGPTGDPNLVGSLPFFLVGLVLFGFAQVINALVRTADASEAMIEELSKITNRQLG